MHVASANCHFPAGFVSVFCTIRNEGYIQNSHQMSNSAVFNGISFSCICMKMQETAIDLSVATFSRVYKAADFTMLVPELVKCPLHSYHSPNKWICGLFVHVPREQNLQHKQRVLFTLSHTGAFGRLCGIDCSSKLEATCVNRDLVVYPYGTLLHTGGVGKEIVSAKAIWVY